MIKVPCSDCGTMVRRLKRRPRVTCTPCGKKNNAAKSRQWYAEHKATVDTGKWWREHPEKRVEYMRAYREKNRTHLRLYARLYARRSYRRNKKLLADLPCDDCGMNHTDERRATILRRMLPCHTSEIHEAWTCIWGPAGKKGSAGEQRLYRDLERIGAERIRQGEYGLPRRAA